jgi:hypothetical protein
MHAFMHMPTLKIFSLFVFSYPFFPAISSAWPRNYKLVNVLLKRCTNVELWEGQLT